MKISLVHVLIVIQLGFLAFTGHRAYKSRHLARAGLIAIYGLATLLAAWAVLSAYLAATGVYTTEIFLCSLPGLWLSFVPVALIVIPAVIFPPLRKALLAIAEQTPQVWFAYLQALRISALGTAIKTLQGAFPIAFELFVGIPDLLFGLSALWVALALKKNRISDRFWITWNAVGAAIILVVGLPILNMSLPGSLEVFSTPPTFLVALEYPLALAPTVAVPLFVAYNVLAIVGSRKRLDADVRR